MADPKVIVRFGAPVDPGVFFGTVGGRGPGVGAHLAAYLVARLLPEGQRGLYGSDPAAYVGHPHFRKGIREHTLADIRAARELSHSL